MLVFEGVDSWSMLQVILRNFRDFLTWFTKLITPILSSDCFWLLDLLVEFTANRVLSPVLKDLSSGPPKPSESAPERMDGKSMRIFAKLKKLCDTCWYDQLPTSVLSYCLVVELPSFPCLNFLALKLYFFSFCIESFVFMKFHSLFFFISFQGTISINTPKSWMQPS